MAIGAPFGPLDFDDETPSWGKITKLGCFNGFKV